MPPRYTNDGKLACFNYDTCGNGAKHPCPFCFPRCKAACGDAPPVCTEHFSEEAVLAREALKEKDRKDRAGRGRGGRYQQPWY